MDNREAVAEAIWRYLVPSSLLAWEEQNDTTRDLFLGCADAALASLELAEDRRRINPKTRPKPCDNCGHLKGVHAEPCVIVMHRIGGSECGCPEHVYTEPETSWQVRLIGPWQEES